MPDPNYKALCAELLGELQALRRAVADEMGCSSPEPSFIARARAALAQTEPLSPAAQAVRKAYYSHSDDDRADPALAAALRAAANQVVPEQIEPPCGESEPWPQSYQLMADSKWEQRQYTRQHLLAIAAELEDLPE
jgi:hypothetical protein